MSDKVKVPGTKYSLEINSSGDDMRIEMTIGGAVEESRVIKNTSLREVTSKLEEIIVETNLNVNPFQVEMMSKDLYKIVSGDEDMSQHQESMKEIENKKELMQDSNVKNALVSEYRDQFKIKEDAPKKQKDKKSKEKKKSSRQIEQNQQDPQMKSMMSEISQNIGTSSDKSPEATSQSSGSVLQSKDSKIDTRVSSVDVEDLVNELLETKSLLKDDINRVNQRMEKIDKIITKISSISSKL